MNVAQRMGETCERMAGRITALTGWRRMLAACAFGAFSALAFAPLGLFPLLLLGFAGTLLLLDGAERDPKPLWRGALTGWAFGYGYFLVGLHWVGYAFLVDPEQNEWLLPFVAVLFPGGMALFHALAGAAYVQFRVPGWPRAFVFAAAMFAVEWLRGHILTGFPWNLPGYGWVASLAIMQSVSLFGVYGLSLLTILLGASLALWAERMRAAHIVAGALIALFVGLWIFGALRLAFADNGTVAGVYVRIVQPDVSQKVKYRPEYVAGEWQSLLELSQRPSARPITHMIWPEAAPPLILMREPQALADIAALTRKNIVLLTGAVRISDNADGERRFYNSFYLFGPTSASSPLFPIEPLATYDKFHLVPFGEYLPFGKFLTALGISQIASSTGDFSAGSGPRTLQAPGAPAFSPLICYEIIFPGEVTDPGEERPGWLVSMTDDSWFGPNAGPDQHLWIARTRAIEEGLPVARAANSGVSAMVDAYGRIHARLHLGLRGVLDADLPVALPPTPFVRFKRWVVLILFLLCAGIPVWASRKRMS